MLWRKINGVKGWRITAITILESVPRQDLKEETYLSGEVSEGREGGMLIAGMRAFQKEETASAKQTETETKGQSKDGRAVESPMLIGSKEYGRTDESNRNQMLSLLSLQ